MPNTTPQPAPTSSLEDEQMRELEELVATAVDDTNNAPLPNAPKIGQKRGREETDNNPEPNNKPNNPHNPHKRPIAPTKLITPATPQTTPSPGDKMTTTAANPRHPTPTPENTQTDITPQNPVLSYQTGPPPTTEAAPKIEDHLSTHPLGINQRDVYAAVADSTKNFWAELEGPHVLAYLAYDKPVEEATERVKLIKELLRAVLDSNSIFVGHAKPSQRKLKEIKPLFPYYVGGITEEQRRRLIEQRCWSTPSITIFIIPDPITPSYFVMSLENFPIEATEENDNLITQTIKRTFRATPHLHSFIAGNRDNIPQNLVFSDLITFVEKSIHVKSIKIIQKGMEIAIFNVYIHPPTKNAKKLESWISKLKGLTYICIHGTGKPRNPPLQCACCKARDHPAGLCKYNDIPGWNNNQSIIVKDRDEEEENENHATYNRGRGNGRGYRGNRSWNNRGRGRGMRGSYNKYEHN
ncbi:hypothetical protein BD779DRAFT_1475374 [Infundibulicybe gibba]|nr:hypothetical protein BD779DRAFT_1475374 [Infundibulicybe gibba]